MRGNATTANARPRPYVMSVDHTPSMPACASSRNGYQMIPHVAAPNISASAGFEGQGFKGAHSIIGR